MVRLFSTQFPLDSGASLDSLLELGKKWIVDHKYSRLDKDEVSCLTQSGDFSEDGRERFELKRANAGNYEVAGLRYTNPDENGGVFIVDSIFLDEKPSKTCVINVTYETPVTGAKIPVAKIPKVLRIVLDGAGGGLDGDVVVKNKPNYLKEDDADFVADILHGKTSSIIPVVYLSRDNHNLLKVKEPDKLADKLFGVAHVFVEPSRGFSFKLNRSSKGYNVFGGAVGIFWAEGFGKYFWLPEHADLKRRDVHDLIYNKIVDGLRTRMLRRELTWENIQSLHNWETIQKLKEGHAKESEESKELAGIYYDEIKTKDHQIEQRDQRILTLENELRRMSANTGYGDGLIEVPQVTQFYEDELKCIVIDALKTAVINTPNNTRRHSLLESIVGSNAQLSNARDEIVKKIKIMFNDFTGLSGPIRNELQRMGFEIVKDGGHYKMYLEGQTGGICVTIPGTPGDRRAGKNLASDILRTFF